MILRRFVDHGHIVAYRVAHFVGRRGFDEALKSAAHGGTVVSKKESGPMLAGHRKGEATTVRCQRQYGNVDFSALRMNSAPAAPAATPPIVRPRNFRQFIAG